MRRFGQILGLLAVLVIVVSAPVRAQDGLSALAHFNPGGSYIRDSGDGIAINLSLSQPVPYRISTMSDPPRLVLDFREVNWTALDPARLGHGSHVTAVRAGLLQPGWSRLVLEMDGPYAVTRAEMATRDLNGRAAVRLELKPESAEAFARTAGSPAARLWAMPKPDLLPAPKRRPMGQRPLIVVLDPGHGGIDPGSVNGKTYEKAITLSFARALREVLIRRGMQVVMTRTSDVFVPLETRISIARAAGADLFLSIHADAEASREATGATVYTLSNTSTDRASAELAARHDRDDIMAGVDLSGTTDRIAKVLMDMARTETQPRSEAFAADLVAAIKAAKLKMHRRPHQEAAFSVLKSPDVPSALLELGYLSSKSDLKNLEDPEWRLRMEDAVSAAIGRWAREDAATAPLLRH